MENEQLIPVVDFSAYSLDRDQPDQETFQVLIQEVFKAFSTIGFVYLVNTGISREVVKDAFTKSENFFKLPADQKKPFTREKDNFGFVSIELEGLNPERPHKDLKEGFNYVPSTISAIEKAKKHGISPKFLDSLHLLFTQAERLHQRIVEVMGRGLNLQDPMMFVKAHNLIGRQGNGSTLRSLFYPPTSDYPTKEGQVRCGEHSDYGGITLLFQDSHGGLEVKQRNGNYIAAKPIEDAVVVNIGDLMQRWTADKLVSTKHRVLMPFSEEGTKFVRQSIAFFGHPDDEEQIVCIDGSNKYPPIGSNEYLQYRFSLTY
ncbi:uncharacterized protein [Antedon mediterranea]|uniref:uncharacterized protein n=1 Tax=Antedon mediterranea TaxID=105859 RepID=UPI003AF5F887